MRPAKRLAATLAQHIIADLKRRRPDWPLIAHLLSDDLRRAAGSHVFAGMIAGNKDVAARFARQQKASDSNSSNKRS